MQWLGAGILMNTIHACRYIQDTYRYIRIHAYIYTCIRIHSLCNECREGVLRCSFERTRLLCAALPTQISSDEAQDGPVECPLRAEGPWAAQGGSFAPPHACRARGCAKTGAVMGPWSRDKVVGLLPRGVLSGVRWVAARGVCVCWARCDGISACLAQCLHYIHYTCAYIQYIQYMHICTLKNKCTYALNTYSCIHIQHIISHICISESLVWNVCICMYLRAYLYVYSMYICVCMCMYCMYLVHILRLTILAAGNTCNITKKLTYAQDTYRYIHIHTSRT